MHSDTSRRTLVTRFLEGIGRGRPQSAHWGHELSEKLSKVGWNGALFLSLQTLQCEIRVSRLKSENLERKSNGG
jgi:hypothetical protein